MATAIRSFFFHVFLVFETIKQQKMFIIGTDLLFVRFSELKLSHLLYFDLTRSPAPSWTSHHYTHCMLLLSLYTSIFDF